MTVGHFQRNVEDLGCFTSGNHPSTIRDGRAHESARESRRYSSSQPVMASPSAAAARPVTRLAATLRAAARYRVSLTSRTVAVVQELKVVRPPASPVARRGLPLGAQPQPDRQPHRRADDEGARHIDRECRPGPVRMAPRVVREPGVDGEAQQGARDAEDPHQHGGDHDAPPLRSARALPVFHPAAAAPRPRTSESPR